MSVLSRCFNAQAARPSWRVARYAAGAVGLCALGVFAGGPVVVDMSGWAALSSAVVSAGAFLNGLRRGFFSPAPH